MQTATHPVISALESKPWLVGRNAIITAKKPGRIVITNFEPEKYARAGEPRKRSDWSVAAALQLEFGNLDRLFSVKTDSAKKTAIVELNHEAQSKIDAAISRLQELGKNTETLAMHSTEFQEPMKEALKQALEKYPEVRTLIRNGKITFTNSEENSIEINGAKELSEAMKLRSSFKLVRMIDDTLIDAYGYRGHHIGTIKLDGREPLNNVPPFALRLTDNGKTIVITARRNVAYKISKNIALELLKLQQLRAGAFAKTKRNNVKTVLLRLLQQLTR